MGSESLFASFREAEIMVGRRGFGFARDRHGRLRWATWSYWHRRFGVKVETG